MGETFADEDFLTAFRAGGPQRQNHESAKGRNRETGRRSETGLKIIRSASVSHVFALSLAFAIPPFGLRGQDREANPSRRHPWLADRRPVTIVGSWTRILVPDIKEFPVPIASLRAVVPMLALVAFGCGSGFGDVHGKVTYKARALASGSVMTWPATADRTTARSIRPATTRSPECRSALPGSPSTL